MRRLRTKSDIAGKVLKNPRKASGPPDGSAGDAMCALMTTSRLIHRFAQSRISGQDLPAKMSGPRMGVLFAVREAGGLRMGDLATRLDVAPRTVTDLVDGLERDGLLVRKPDPVDRRATRLELAPGATTDFDKMHAIRASMIAEIFSPLSPAQRRTLVALLDKLRQGPIGKVAAALWEDAAKQPSFPRAPRDCD